MALLLAGACARVHAADRYYVGPDGGNWNSATNWSATSGGAGGAGVPGNGDRAFLDPAVTKSLVFDGSYSAPGLSLLYLDGKSGATITLNQGANAMVGGLESIGVQGNAVYHQTGGSNASTSDFHVGQSGGGTGSYLLDSGSLDVAASEYVGEPSSIGNFTQNGGTHVVHDALKIAYSSGSTGHFTLNNGSIDVNDLSGYLNLGYQGTGTFTQTGGSVDAKHLQMADGLAGNATYDLQSGDLTVHGSEAIGTGGIGVFHQTGGTHTMTGNMTITGTLNPGSSGTYNLDGGTLNVTGNIENYGTMTQAAAASLNLGGTVIGNGIIQTNGPFVLANQTNINSGTIQISGGNATGQTLIVGHDAADPDVPADTILGNGVLQIQGGTTTVNGVLGAGNDGTLASGTGTGEIDVTAGTLNARTVILGSAAGGTATMRVGGTGQVVIGGGFTQNDLIMDGGALTVLDQNPPPGEDPVLDRSMVGGYLRDGAMHVHAGAVTSPKIKLGVTAGKTGSMDMTGGTVTVGILGAGNDATLTGGQGIGSVDITGGTLNAKTVMLGSSAGGTATMRVGGTGQVVIGGGLSANDLIVDAGTVTVLDQPPPVGEDPVLDRSIVGGYLRDGAMTVNGGAVTTPNLKVGVTAGKVGTLTLNGGTLTAANLLAPNGAGSVIALNGGTLASGHSVVDGPSALVVGNGSSAARLNLSPAGGTHSFADGMSIAANAQLTGAGAITGAVTNGGTVSPGANTGDTGLLSVAGAYTQSAGGTLTLDVGSGAAGTGYDALRVSGTATLSGTLRLRFTGGHLPGIGQQQQLVIGHPRVGTFASIVGSGFGVSYTDSSVVATYTGLDAPVSDGRGLALSLEPARPNPLGVTGSSFGFTLPRAGAVTLAIHDLSGRLVRVVAAGEYEAGRHTATWDGRDQSGAAVRPGVYLVRLAAQGTTLSRKLVVR